MASADLVIGYRLRWSVPKVLGAALLLALSSSWIIFGPSGDDIQTTAVIFVLGMIGLGAIVYHLVWLRPSARYLSVDSLGIEHVWFNRKLVWAEIASVHLARPGPTLEILLKPGAKPPGSHYGFVIAISLADIGISPEQVFNVVQQRLGVGYPQRLPQE